MDQVTALKALGKFQPLFYLWFGRHRDILLCVVAGFQPEQIEKIGGELRVDRNVDQQATGNSEFPGHDPRPGGVEKMILLEGQGHRHCLIKSVVRRCQPLAAQAFFIQAGL